MENLIELYKAGSKKPNCDLELELRFKNIDRAAFKTFFESAQQKATFKEIEQTVATTTKEYDANKLVVLKIRSQKFANGKKISDDHIYKQQLAAPIKKNDQLEYTINLSCEGTSQPFESNFESLVRLKNRASFIIDNNWRLDMTLVRASLMKDIKTSLINIKDRFFAANTVNNFMSADANMVTNYSVELEYIGDKSKMSSYQIENIVKIFIAYGDIKYLIASEYETELKNVAKYLVKNHLRLSHFSVKTVSNQAIVLNKNAYRKIWPPTGFLLTDKTDGIRCLISIYGDRCRLLTNKLVEFQNTANGKNTEVTIVDAEIIYESETKFHIYIFDVMVIRDDDLTDKPFSERIDSLVAASKQVEQFVGVGNVSAKHYVRLTESALKSEFDSVYKAKHPYNIDGLILSTHDKNYEDTDNFKWKPIAHSTIDFLAKKAPSTIVGKSPYIQKPGHDIYILFNGIRYEMQRELGLTFIPEYDKIITATAKTNYYPIQFSPSINPYAFIYYHKTTDANIDGKIVELRFNTADPKNIWEFVRIRTDRETEKNYYGNDFRNAETTFQDYFIKFEYESLSAPDFGYFASNVAEIYKSSNKYKRFVISNIFEKNIKNAKWVIDLAAGRGADTHRYQELGVGNLLAVDIDPEAISELITRKFEYSKQLRRVKNSDNMMTIHAMIQDLKEDAEIINGKLQTFPIPSNGVDAIIMNFAIHYFCDSAQNLQNLVRIVAANLKVGGVFIFTTMSGQAIFSLLAQLKNGEKYVVMEGPTEKYVIKKAYNGKKLAKTGQLIEIKLPFSDEMYEEPLANIDYIVAECKRAGLELLTNYPFDMYFDDFKTKYKRFYDTISEDDLSMIALHNYVILRKIK